MNTKIYTLVIVVAFGVAAIFGLYVPLVDHQGHGMGCPFVSGVALCSVLLEHIGHWQMAFMGVLIEMLILSILVAAFFIRLNLGDPYAKRYALYRALHVPMWPVLFQELFSNGVLHRKEPYRFWCAL